MIDFKLGYAIQGLLLFMIGQFMNMNIPRLVAATRQAVDIRHPIYQADGSTSNAHPVHQQFALVGILGSSGVVSKVVNGKRDISKAQAKALGEFFHVSPALFL